MKMNKMISVGMAFGMALSVLTGCGSSEAATQTKAETVIEASKEDVVVEGAVKTGLSVITSVAKSTDAEADKDGNAQMDMTLVAVTVDEAGVIDECVIDSVKTTVAFDSTGKVLTDTSVAFASKNELGDDYGMRVASSIGKEWNEQAAAMAAYAEGKTIEELKGLAVNESGAPADEDLASSVTLHIGDFISGIEAAVNHAEYLGAQKGDTLKLVSITDVNGTASATEEAEGMSQSNVYIGVVTLSDEQITGCLIDAVKANINFDMTGKITSDLSAAILTKNELGDDYGMRVASSIGKEWNEQAASFASYVTGKTVDEVAGISVDENGKATDADITSSVTLAIGTFQELIAKAAK